jgi:hypothetical protein
MSVGSPEPLSRFEIAAPVWVERVSVRLHLYVAPNGDIGEMSVYIHPDLLNSRFGYVAISSIGRDGKKQVPFWELTQ